MPKPVLGYGKDVYDKERYQEIKELALHLMSTVVDQDAAALTLLTEKNEGYPTPKVDVRALIQRLFPQDLASEASFVHRIDSVTHA